ncbi:MAG TPA: S53 family peptidase, partial [Solirubrobacteraceae bacterium]
MNQRTLTRTERRTLALAAGLLGLVVSLGLHPPAATAAAAAGTPSPASHRIGALCAAPSPGRSGCLGLRLVSDEPAAEQSTPIPQSLTPANILTAYALNGITPPSTQTIALVDAYDNATIAEDLETFDKQFSLPSCNEANGCFRKVNQEGEVAPLPESSGPKERGWAQEIATDVEVAHGVCQSCKILLVEANSNENNDLYTAEQTAVALGATEISNSWGGEEPSFDSPAFNHPGVVITASSGDEGYLDWLTGEPSAAAQYPASSPHVIGVGGTRLLRNAESGAWEGETVWNDGGFNGLSFEGAGAGGGGCSASFAATSWQQSVPDWSSVGCGGLRAVADVSADADPYTGVAVYDSTETPEGEKGWAMIGGTSVASPIVASVFALAGGAHGVAYPSHTLYENLASDPSSLHDVVSGSNGECLKRPSKKTGASTCSAAEEAASSCEGHAICLAGAGFDGP